MTDDFDDELGGAHTSDGQARPNENTDSYGIAAEELRQFVERYEQLDSEKKDVADQQKELMAEAKGRGYCTKTIKKVVAERKRKPDDIAEEAAILDIYKTAMGMLCQWPLPK